MSGNCVATGTIVNNTGFDMWVVSSGIASGHWKTAPLNVGAGATKQSWVAQGTSGTATGTSGWVQYRLQGTSPSALITVYFDDPFSSSNSAGGTNSNSAAYAVGATFPHSGHEVTFTYTISPAT